MATVALDIPSEVFHAARMSPEQMKIEVAVHLFEQEKLSFGKSRQLADMTIWQFM